MTQTTLSLDSPVSLPPARRLHCAGAWSFKAPLAAVAGALIAGSVAAASPASPTAMAHTTHQHPAAAAKDATPAANAAPVAVVGAWVRPTVKGQQGTGGFMRLTSAQALTLVGFSSPAARSAELHEMAMDGDVMRMRPIDALPLPAGQPVDLKPGGHHLMLMGLKQPLKAGTTVPLVLRLRTEGGQVLQQAVQVPVRTSAPADAPKADAGHEHHHHDHHHDH